MSLAPRSLKPAAYCAPANGPTRHSVSGPLRSAATSPTHLVSAMLAVGAGLRWALARRHVSQSSEARPALILSLSASDRSGAASTMPRIASAETWPSAEWYTRAASAGERCASEMVLRPRAMATAAPVSRSTTMPPATSPSAASVRAAAATWVSGRQASST